MLKEIVANKHREVADLKRRQPLEKLKEELAGIPEKRNFYSALKGSNIKNNREETNNIKIIAEIKKASPSHGTFNTDFLRNNSVAEVARIYESAGAAAISVLTDEKYFSGSPAYLQEAKKATTLPVLRKDFIVDEYQLYETAVMGADAILLIVSLLSYPELKYFLELARELKMSALIEAVNEEELLKAQEAGAGIIGINNRNLKNMEIDINRTIKLASAVQSGKILVSESGINTREQVELLYERAGIAVILVGTGIVTSDDPIKKIRELKGDL